MNITSRVSISPNDSYTTILEDECARLRARNSELEGMNQLLLNVIKRLQTKKPITKPKKNTPKKTTHTRPTAKTAKQSPQKSSKKQAKIDVLTRQIRAWMLNLFLLLALLLLGHS